MEGFVFIAFLGLISFLPLFILWATDSITRHNAARRIEKISENFVEVPIPVRKKRFFYAGRYDFKGVYILYNTSKNKYYVGQSVNVFKRIRQHFTGYGNGGVYHDYLEGDKFTVKAIPLMKSGYSSLNSLERDTIAAYNAYRKGYNRTRGNRG